MGLQPAAHQAILCLYRMPQELRSILGDLIPELMLNQKHHTHMGPIATVQEL
jgi:hypothetical protein